MIYTSVCCLYDALDIRCFSILGENAHHGMCNYACDSTYCFNYMTV